MNCLHAHPRFLVLAGVLGATSCVTPTANTICADPDTPEVVALCALDAAQEAPQTSQGKREACEAIKPIAWRDGCVVQVAERQAWEGDLPGAFESCLAAPTLTAQCLQQVGWSGVQGRVTAGPGSVDVSAQIDVLLDSLPDPGIGAALKGYQSAHRIVRASTWHGVYAGSGSTDPTALNAAGASDQPYARAAFAWEAVRLLPPHLSVEDTVAAVQAIASGERLPLTGAPQVQACWQDSFMPRVDEDFRLKPVTQAYGSWLRFTDIDPEVDLMIAIYDAIMLHRRTLPAPVVLALKAHPSPEVQKTAARYVALLAPPKCGRPGSEKHAALCAERGWETLSQGEVWNDERRYVLTSTRMAVHDGRVPKLFPPVPCP